jgi:hypothetical protein
MRTRLAWWVVSAIPAATRTGLGLTHAAAAALGALVVVNSLVPVFAVCLAALGARPTDPRRLSASPGPARESA